NNVPLTDSEMQQILEQIKALKTPLALNGFINGKTISITRDNPNDHAHLGKEISLKIYDRQEIAAGQSRYQIAQQPKFPTTSPILKDRRGDLMLLINGMPVFHLELKRSGVPISQAYEQIRKYESEGIFTGLFSLVQIFVAMTPNQTRYFANPNGNFNPNYYFQWADFNNEPINGYKEIASSLLSIPMAHQLIGFYMIPDDTDGVLKVMRSYQYYAANAISDRVAKLKWHNDNNQRGGYIWHTTGSGKTMTSFKSAHLIALSKNADKVIFLMDRIELGTQSLKEYRNFADENTEVQATENTAVLITKLKSNKDTDTLIVTSIQKLSHLAKDKEMKQDDLAKITDKRLVIIVDECHRSTFGDMLREIKSTFKAAVFFGFTGTPIFEDNKKQGNETVDVFGDQLHRYSIADGIRDKNVLGFDPYQINTYKDRELRKAVALTEAKAGSEEEVWQDEAKTKIYNHFMQSVPMATQLDSESKEIKGIEDYLPPAQWKTPEHKAAVVQDIKDNFSTLSQGKTFHAIFATSSIPEAIEYYRLLKAEYPELKTTALFDPNEGNNETSIEKEQGLVEIIEDYNHRYGRNFTIPTHDKFKKDIADRLAHKGVHKFIDKKYEEQLDLLIVVDQMLTGYDSKWVNTLYLDKVIGYELLIQAFSRTNRLFGENKPHGTIRYYRKPHTMTENVNKAVKLYSGDRVPDLFVDKLPSNIQKMNGIFTQIQAVFLSEKIANFAKNPTNVAACAKFVKLFNDFNQVLSAAKVQGFEWATLSYGEEPEKVTLECDEQTYLILLLRYKELAQPKDNEPKAKIETPAYDIASYITEINTGKIDSDYLNSRFEKYIKALNNDENSEQALNELHQAFPSLSKDEQAVANVILGDIQRGDLIIENGKSFKDYIVLYQSQQRFDEIHQFAENLGLNETLLREILNKKIDEHNINNFIDQLKPTANKEKAKRYFENEENKKIPPPMVNIKLDKALRHFLQNSNKG
ncbi:MAG: HsdR family type I site-specific deoxyribonuclease, partial [Lonepinella koalarum]|nr:HsdR family type I site-specific deoxyribonuclease [Lonepinella koalarum]